MALEISIQKRLGEFQLNMHLKSSSRRIGILGVSGCGKSMTLRCIAGVERPDFGQVLVDGQVMFDSETHIDVKPQKRSIGYLFQNYALFPTMTVAENIGASLRGTREAKREQVARMVERFQLKGLEGRLPGQLSGGQQQRTALARIMAYEPDMILLDEPFSALDDNLKERLQQEVRELLEDYPGTVILVSHSRDEIYRFCQELVIMDQGHDICHGMTEDVFAAPAFIRAAQLTGCKNIAPLERIDSHHGCVAQWGLKLHTRGTIPTDATHLGIRAHDFVPLWAGEEACGGGGQACGRLPVSKEDEIPDNCLPVQVKSMARLPFEVRYYLKSPKDGKEGACWFLQREQQEAVAERGMPRWLLLPEEKLLYLK